MTCLAEVRVDSICPEITGRMSYFRVALQDFIFKYEVGKI